MEDVQKPRNKYHVGYKFPDGCYKGGVSGYHLGFLVQEANVKADKKD